MQQPAAGGGGQAPFPATSITTELIQKYLDENKQLILAILDNQSLGKLTECAHYQARLQQNLMFLAAIADAQPQAPQPPPPMQQTAPTASPPSFNQFPAQPQSSYPPQSFNNQSQNQAASQQTSAQQNRAPLSGGESSKEGGSQEGHPSNSVSMEGVARNDTGAAAG